jgi:hypothetical protein
MKIIGDKWAHKQRGNSRRCRAVNRAPGAHMNNSALLPIIGRVLPSHIQMPGSNGDSLITRTRHSHHRSDRCGNRKPFALMGNPSE